MIINILAVEAVREALKKSLYADIAQKGGGEFNPCPNIFGALFYGALYLGKMPKGGRAKALPTDLDHF